jgi:Brp/Blh family beta-carotene 15,15'-monooxygenase
MILRAKYYQFTIAITLLFMVFGFSLNRVIMDGIGLILIFSAGLIHGANDIRLLQKKYQRNQFSFFVFLILLYVTIVILGAVLFFYLPVAGLFFFILFSGFHFGEQHWNSFLVKRNATVVLIPLGFTFYGLLIFALLFSLQHQEVAFLIEQISGLYFSIDTYYTGFLVLLLLFSLFALVLPIGAVLFLKELLSLILLAALFSSTSLLMAFAVYFVFWHSIPSIQDQLMYLDGAINYRTVKEYIKSSLVYWILSIVGLVAFYFFFDLNSSYFVPLFFSFLAAITFPHTLVIGMLESE